MSRVSVTETFVSADPDVQPTDEELASRFLQWGDEDAFRSLFERYRVPLARYASRMLGRPEEGDEVCTDVFLRLCEGRWRARRGPLRGWLFTVAHRLCLDRLRRRQSAGARLLQLVGLPGPPTVEDDAVADDAARALRRALEQLPAPHRAAILLYYGEELPSFEVASILGLEDHQVRSQLAYARRRLRALMTDEEDT